MLVIGLTGGIGSGKSTIANLFAELGVPLVDADIVAREVVAPGQPALQQIAEQFGSEMLTPEGRLDRSQLRQHIFANPHAKQQLEALLHPLIRQQMAGQITQLAADNHPYCLSVIPLLLESGLESSVDRILVVDCSEARQHQRVASRDGVSSAQIDAIIQQQASRQQRLDAADDLISNEQSSIEELKTAVRQLHRAYLSQAGEKLQKIGD